MRYLALATDYDGTLAHDGHVDSSVLAALDRVRASGRRLILVTGRQLGDLQAVFPPLDRFDLVVAENGGLLYRPATHEETPLGEPPPRALIEALADRNVAPLSVGRVIVATWHPHESTVLAAIEALGLEHQVIFNKGAVMVLPPGVNKASGLQAALAALGLSPHNTVGIGDAENDHAFLALGECAVAVANALPTLKEHADWVTSRDHGAGVVELVDRLVGDDLAALAPRLARHDIVLGTREGGEEVTLPPYGVNVLIAGPSGSGKSTLATGILERLAERAYQFCLLDPEGDYETVAGAVILGDGQRPPTIAEVCQVLEQPAQHAIVNLLGLPLADRPGFFAELLTQLTRLRSATGRPHWLAADEAHHLVPAAWDAATQTLPQTLSGLLLLTVHPDHVAPAVLERIEVVIAVGEAPADTLQGFARAVGVSAPAGVAQHLDEGTVLVWLRHRSGDAIALRPDPSRTERQRHRRKYARGELGRDKSFYFRGPTGALNLRAHNLTLFVEIAAGVDDATWQYHLQRGDYSRWFHAAIKDEALAAEAAAVEAQPERPPVESRRLIREAIERRYTLPS